jgi:hypothetical protein
MKKINKTYISPMPQTKSDSLKNKLVERPSLANKKDLQLPDLTKMYKYSEDKIKIAKEILKQFPDIEKGAMLLVSSIISPNDLSRTGINVTIDSNIIVSDVLNKVLRFIKDELIHTYNLKDNLYNMFYKALITEGAYVTLFIPNNLLDDFISANTVKYSLESMVVKSSKRVNYITHYKKDKVTNYISKYITVTDNLNILRAKELYKRQLDEVTLESGKKSVLDKLFKKVKNNKMTSIYFPNVKEIDNERCMVMNIPTESIFPIYVNNEVDNHLGYLILLDMYGNPIKINHKVYDSSDNFVLLNTIINKAQQRLTKVKSEAPIIENIDTIAEPYLKDIIKNMILDKRYTNLVDYETLNNIYKIMFSRVLEGLKTTILYIPARYVNYTAFDYRINGTGKPLIEDLEVIASMRNILRFAKVSAQVKNSIPNTKVTVKLDEDDPDMEKTMEEIKGMIMNLNESLVPIGIIDSYDVSKWLHSAGYTFEFKGGQLPDMTIDINDSNRNIPIPDKELEDDLKKSMYMKMGLSPELIESINNVKFATEILTENVMFNRWVRIRQRKGDENLSDFLRKVLLNDGYIRNALLELLNSNLPEIKKQFTSDMRKALKENHIKNSDIVYYIYDEIVKKVEVVLPSIETENSDLHDKYKTYKDRVEDYVEHYISEDALPAELIGEFGDDMRILQKAISNTLIRKWFVKNDYMTELINLFDIDENGNVKSDILEDYDSYMKSIIDSFERYLKSYKKNKEDLNKIKEKYDGDDNEDNDTNDSDNDSDTYSDDNDNTDESDVGDSDSGTSDNDDSTDSGGDDESDGEDKEDDDKKDEKEEDGGGEEDADALINKLL